MAIDRREFAALMLGAAASVSAIGAASAQDDPLPSWNQGAAKDAIIKFVHATTDAGSPQFVPLAERIATFDQDGTLWVEQPIYTQIVFAFDRVPRVVKETPSLRTSRGSRRSSPATMQRSPASRRRNFFHVIGATLTGMDVDEYRDEVAAWIRQARDPRWKRPFTELVYQPQIELLKYLRANGFRTYIVTGGGQDFVRGLCRADLRHSARAGGGNDVRAELRPGRGRQDRSHPGTRSFSSTTTTPASPRASIL